MADVNKQIADLMAQLGSMSYTPPSSYKGYQSTPWGVDRSAHYADNLKQYDPNDFASLKKGSSTSSGLKPDFWGMLNGTLGQAGAAITDSFNNIAKDIEDPKKGIGEKIFDVLLKDTVGNSIIHGIGNGAKEQWKDWTDGKASWGDVPLVGMLHGMYEGYAKPNELSGRLGMKDDPNSSSFWGRHAGTIGGIGISILDDPLTYMTGGASLATKLGKVAEGTEIMNQAKNLGITGKFKNLEEFKGAVIDALRNKYAKYPNLADRAVESQYNKIVDAVEGARASAYNGNINKWGVSIPFSNKMTMAGGNIAEKLPMTFGKVANPLYRTEATLGAHSHLVDQLIEKAANGDEDSAAFFRNAIKARYGVHDFADITKTQYEDLLEKIAPFMEKSNVRGLPDAKIYETMTKQSMPNNIYNIKTREAMPVEHVEYNHTTVDDILKQLDPKVAAKVEPMLRGLNDVNDIRKLAPEAVKMYGDFAKKIMKTAKGKTLAEVQKSFNDAAEILKNATHTGTITKAPDIVWKELTRMVQHFPKGNPDKLASLENARFVRNANDFMKAPYTKMNNAKTSFEHFLDRHNPFDARTLKTGDKFVNSMADHVADANSQRIGEQAKYIKGLSKVQSFIRKNKITDQEMKEAIYHLENKAPHSYGKDWVPSDRVQGLANTIRPIIDAVGKDENAAGVLNTLRNHYFPHVVNKTDEEMKAMMEFDKRHPDLNGLKQTNKFDQARNSFPTIADQDNYLAKLSSEAAKATDPAEKAALEEQIKRVENLFDTDVVSALQRRIKEGVRAKAMRDMQGKLRKFGMAVTNPTDSSMTKGLKKLDASEVKKLGLGAGEHYMHPEVLNGLKRVDEIFTNEGMNKFARTLSAISDIWRPLVTYYKPSHYTNNLIGNVINNLAAGVKISDYKAAGKLLTGYRSGKLTEEQMRIMNLAYKHNVVSGGFLFDSKANFEFTDPTKLEKFAKFVADNRAVKGSRVAGEKVDDISRLANFVNGLDKFGSVEKAANQVRTYLFNYNELTNADRAMRVAVPFWNWTKRNIPLQMKLLMENPKFIMNNQRFRDLFNTNQEGADWQKDSGIHVSDNYYAGVPNPSSDLEMLTNPAQFLGSLNPAIKMTAEMALNKKFFTGKPISYGSDSLQAADVPSYLAGNMGIGGNMYDWATGKKGNMESLINLLKPISKINHVGQGGN